MPCQDLAGQTLCLNHPGNRRNMRAEEYINARDLKKMLIDLPNLSKSQILVWIEEHKMTTDDVVMEEYTNDERRSSK